MTLLARVGRTLAFFCLICGPALAPPASEATARSETPSVITVPPAAQPSANFNADAATEAYLAEIPRASKDRSDAYFEGGYWMILWNFIYQAIVLLLFLDLRWSAAMRNFAERLTRFRPVRTMIYTAELMAVATVLRFPLAVYEEYFREHKYGLATQSFGPWVGDQAKMFAVNLVLIAIIATMLFGIVRRLPKTWHVWGPVAMIPLVVLSSLIAPIFISPLFNKTTVLDDPKVTEPILSMARANGSPAHDVYKIDASKQSTRMSANVSGFGTTLRITLNDNLLRRGSPEEIQSVMGHEMGHYAMNHVYKGILYFLVVIAICFTVLRWTLDWSLSRWGKKWEIAGIGDTAVLPLVLLIASIFSFVLTPINNTFARTQEHEADMFGLNASRQPDGFAQAAIHLGEYRKMSPGPIEEWIFFDHPSGRNRIHDSMLWKAKNLKLMTGQQEP